MNIKALQQALTDTGKEMTAMLAKADAESRNLNEEETAAYAKLEAKFDETQAALARAQKQQERERTVATMGQPVQPEGTKAVDDPDDPNGEGFKAGDVVNHGPRLLKDPKRGFTGLGEFSMIVRSATLRPEAMDKRLALMAAATGMSQGVGSDGGFLVPPQFSTAIWDGLNKGIDTLLGRTDQYTVEGESITFNANAETSRATGSRYGGVRGYWFAEAAQMTSSKPTFRQVKLEPQQLGVLVYLTDKLMKNSSIALEQYVTRAATEEINFLVSDAIINGTGAGQPLGIVGHAATVSVAAESGQAAATIVKANIDKMWARCHARARNNAVWFINQDIEPQLENLAMAVGTGGVPVYLPPGGIADTPNARLKGRPVIPIEYCATLGTVGDIILADLSAYTTGTMGGVESAMSMHLRFDYNETALRFIFAVDGRPWLASALTPFKGTNPLSPIVTLATRS